MAAVDTRYIELIAAHIRDIGKLTATDIHRIEEMARMSKNLNEIAREVGNLTGYTMADIKKLLKDSVEEQYGSWKAAGILPKVDNAEVKKLIDSLFSQTYGTMLNLSNTTVVSTAYKRVIDDAITAVQLGYTDYKSAVRRGIKGVVNEGLRVQFESGLTRRLDTAMRQNVTNAVRQINQNLAFEVGKTFGADGVELSAHGTCAEDHLPYQGKQYTMKQFQQLQDSLKRPIGEWNCRHTVFPIIMGISEPTYSEAQLAEMAEMSRRKTTIGEKTLTSYQWSQEMRKIETDVRYAKDSANAYRIVGDDVGRRYEQQKIEKLTALYNTIVRMTGLPSEKDRMTVATFKWVKASQPVKNK